jgi:hypothetical protein
MRADLNVLHQKRTLEKCCEGETEKKTKGFVSECERVQQL